ncbi:unnamed protein product [Rotaria socialis]
MADNNGDHPISSQLTETISFDVNIDIIRNSEFQGFVTNLERSQHVIIIMNETHGMVIINGKKTAVKKSRVQIEGKISKLSSGYPPPQPSAPIDQVLSNTIELSVAKNNFLENFGQKTLNTIREQAGINSANIINGKLQLSGNNAAITKIKSYLKETLYEKNLSITFDIKKHLESTWKGCILKEFSKKYRVGTSLQEFRLCDRNKGDTTPKRGLPNARGRHYANTSQRKIDDPKEGDRKERYKPKVTEYEDAANQGEDDDEDDDDNNSQGSNSDQSLSANCITNRFNMMNFNDRAEQSIEVSLCSDSEASLSKALAELQSYSFKIESWTLTEDELTFILKQQQRGRPMQNNMPIRERCIQINVYLHHLAQNPFLHIYIYYTRGMWHVKVSGFTSDVHSAVSKIRSYLNDVVDTEVQIPISGVMAFFLRRKASADINRLGNLHNIKIITFSPPRRANTTNEHDNDNHCLKLIGSVSRIDLGHTAIQNFLENLSEKEQDFPCATWDISKNISANIITCLKKIHDSDDYEAVGMVKFYNSAIERRQTTPKVTITVVAFNKETADDVIQQLHNTSDGYRPKPLDTYHLKMQYKEEDWNIISINNTAVKQAEIAIRKAIVSATISEPFSVNLKEDIDAHKTAITTIAIQQFIHIDFQQDSTGNLSLILKGFQQNILQAKLQISLYVQDILRMEADKDDELDIPRQWGDQEEQFKLVELLKNDTDFIRIEKRMRETVSNVKIDKIERVQNLRLWNHYALRRRILQQELSNKPNLQIEMELFHGTRAAPPKEIYNGEYGFDMTFCTSGLWGLGTYFAMNASYSCQSYSYQLPNGKRQVFLAQVLTGEVFDYKGKNDQTLRRPPKKNESISETRYNSVAGETGGSKVYIVYENRVAYPTFLITYSQ